MAKVEKRPEALRGFTYRITCGCGTIYVTINENDDKPFEVFINFGKSGKCANITLDALAITISHGLRAGVPLEEYLRAFRGYSCELRIPGIRNKGTSISSCVDAVAQVFQRYLHEKGVGVALEGKKLTDDFQDEAEYTGDNAPAEPMLVDRLPDTGELSLSETGPSDVQSESKPAIYHSGQARLVDGDAESEDAGPIPAKVAALIGASPGAMLNVRAGEICKLCRGGPVVHESGCDICLACGESYDCGH